MQDEDIPCSPNLCQDKIWVQTFLLLPCFGFSEKEMQTPRWQNVTECCCCWSISGQHHRILLFGLYAPCPLGWILNSESGVLGFSIYIRWYNYRRYSLRLHIRRNFFSEEEMLRHWHRLPTEMVDTLCLEVFKGCGDVTLKDMVSEHGRDGLVVGINDLSDLFQH